jgi:hypothetical protein
VNSNVARKDCSHRLPDIFTLNVVERQLDRVSSIIFSELDPLGSSWFLLVPLGSSWFLLVPLGSSRLSTLAYSYSPLSSAVHRFEIAFHSRFLSARYPYCISSSEDSTTRVLPVLYRISWIGSLQGPLLLFDDFWLLASGFWLLASGLERLSKILSRRLTISTSTSTSSSTIDD